MDSYVANYSGPDHSAAEQFQRLMEILQGFYPKYAAPTFANSWANLNAALYSPAGYYKDPYNRVYLRGALTKASGAVALSVFTLPVGYRPAFGISCPALAYNGAVYIAAAVSISTAGVVTPILGAINEFWLDGISFAV